MVDLRALRKTIRSHKRPEDIVAVSRRWLEEVERDLTELQLRRSKEASK